MGVECTWFGSILFTFGRNRSVSRSGRGEATTEEQGGGSAQELLKNASPERADPLTMLRAIMPQAPPAVLPQLDVLLQQLEKEAVERELAVAKLAVSSK